VRQGSCFLTLRKQRLAGTAGALLNHHKQTNSGRRCLVLFTEYLRNLSSNCGNKICQPPNEPHLLCERTSCRAVILFARMSSPPSGQRTESVTSTVHSYSQKFTSLS